MNGDEFGFWDQVRPDLTALIDGVFLLLIFFMVTMVFARPTRLNIELAEARNPEAVEHRHNYRLVITRQGSLQLENSPVTRAELEQALRTLVQGHDKARLTVLVDRGAAHAHTLDAMELAQAAGLTRVYLATRSRTSEGSP